jgi:hypothetical protein
VALVAALQAVSAPLLLRWGGAAALVLFGVYKMLARRAHPRWVGMRVSPRELVLWSFLMATAHGAGLMLFPVLLGLDTSHHAHAGAWPAGVVAAAGAATGGIATGVAAVLVHTLAMLLVMGALALVVYDKLGLAILRRAWVNLDIVWAAAIIAGGVSALFL